MSILIDVTYLISQLYNKELWSSTITKNRKSLMKLKHQIALELEYQSELMKTKGVLETIFCGGTS